VVGGMGGGGEDGGSNVSTKKRAAKGKTRGGGGGTLHSWRLMRGEIKGRKGLSGSAVGGGGISYSLLCRGGRKPILSGFTGDLCRRGACWSYCGYGEDREAIEGMKRSRDGGGGTEISSNWNRES